MTSNIIIRTCKECGFVGYTPFIKCPHCGKMRQFDPKQPKPTKK